MAKSIINMIKSIKRVFKLYEYERECCKNIKSITIIAIKYFRPFLRAI